MQRLEIGRAHHTVGRYGERHICRPEIPLVSGGKINYALVAWFPPTKSGNTNNSATGLLSLSENEYESSLTVGRFVNYDPHLYENQTTIYDGQSPLNYIPKTYGNFTQIINWIADHCETKWNVGVFMEWPARSDDNGNYHIRIDFFFEHAETAVLFKLIWGGQCN